VKLHVQRIIGKKRLPGLFRRFWGNDPVARIVKFNLSRLIAAVLRNSTVLRTRWRRIWGHAHLAAGIRHPLPASVVVLGRPEIYGTGNIVIGSNVLLYPHVHLETQGEGIITIGNDAVVSSGTHIVSRSSVTIGQGSMIGESTSVRDANHTRAVGKSLRGSDDISTPIVIGREVWIGRGVAVLEGVTIGDYATVGANAVVSRDVPCHTVVAGVPARAIKSHAEEPVAPA
jgi:acetyltransferase-like isoleucine patch superfamily enzyme